MPNMDTITRLYYMIFPMKFIRYHAYRVLEMVKKCAYSYDRDGVVLLDIGAGDTPYKKIFKKLKYKSQDYVQNKSNTIDYVFDISNTNNSIPDDFADVVICTQVLEHVGNPYDALHEIYRVLKRDGVCYLSTHMAFEEHMLPHDYWRFTEHGIKRLARSVGFEILEFHKHGGSAQMLHLLFWTWPLRIFFPKRTGLAYVIYCVLSTPFVLISGMASLTLDLFDRNPTIYPNFEIVLSKEM